MCEVRLVHLADHEIAMAQITCILGDDRNPDPRYLHPCVHEPVTAKRDTRSQAPSPLNSRHDTLRSYLLGVAAHISR